MKCPYCGASLALNDEFCSHCGKLNEQARKHMNDMRYYQREFSETKEEVYRTTRRYTAVIVRIAVIAVLVLLNVAVAFIGSNYYSFERMLGKADCERHVQEYTEILDTYLEEEAYYDFYYFIQEKHVPLYDSPYEQYYQIENLVSQYTYLYNYLLEAYMEEDVSYCEDLCKYAADTLEYFYDNLDTESFYYYENADRAENLDAIEDLKAKVELLLITYGGISPEEASQFADYTSAKRAILLEEGVLNGK